MVWQFTSEVDPWVVSDVNTVRVQGSHSPDTKE